VQQCPFIGVHVPRADAVANTGVLYLDSSFMAHS